MERLPMRGFRKRGGQIGWYYLCQRSEGGVCLTLLRAGCKERLPLGDDGCCFTFVFVLFKEILPTESDSLLGVDMRLTGVVKILHSQLPRTKQSTPQLIT